MIAGTDVPSFSLLNKICDLLGINREWLLDHTFFPFYQKPRYVFAGDFLEALGKGEVRSKEGTIFRSYDPGPQYK